MCLLHWEGPQQPRNLPQHTCITETFSTTLGPLHKPEGCASDPVLPGACFPYWKSHSIFPSEIAALGACYPCQGHSQELTSLSHRLQSLNITQRLALAHLLCYAESPCTLHAEPGRDLASKTVFATFVKPRILLNHQYFEYRAWNQFLSFRTSEGNATVIWHRQKPVFHARNTGTDFPCPGTAFPRQEQPQGPTECLLHSYSNTSVALPCLNSPGLFHSDC